MSEPRSEMSGAVVVGIDGTDKDAAAIRWAADEAAHRGTRLHLLHAYPWIVQSREYGAPPPPDVVESNRPMLARATALAHAREAGLTVTTEIVMERASDVLVRASRTALMLVLGSRGEHHRPGHRPRGAVSEKVVAHAHGTVVVVRDVAGRVDGPVVVGVDPLSSPPQILEFAFEHARARGVGVRLVHGFDRDAVLSEVADQRVVQVLDRVAHLGAEALDKLAGEWGARYPGVEVTTAQLPVHPVAALVEAAREASLLVVGSRAERGLAGLRLGSVSRGVLHAAPVVAVVRVAHRAD